MLYQSIKPCFCALKKSLSKVGKIQLKWKDLIQHWCWTLSFLVPSADAKKWTRVNIQGISTTNWQVQETLFGHYWTFFLGIRTLEETFALRKYNSSFSQLRLLDSCDFLMWTGSRLCECQKSKYFKVGSKFVRPLRMHCCCIAATNTDPSICFSLCRTTLTTLS